jgi:hypothetical protein
LETEFAASRLSRTAEIYVPLAIGRDVIRYDPLLNRDIFAVAIAVTVVFFLGLWGFLGALFLPRTADEV